VISRSVTMGLSGVVFSTRCRARLISRNKTKQNETKRKETHTSGLVDDHTTIVPAVLSLSRARPRRPPLPSRSVQIRDELPLQPRATVARLSHGNFENLSTRAGEPIASDVLRGRERPPDPLRAVATVLQRPFDVAVEGHTLVTLVACYRPLPRDERRNERTGGRLRCLPADVVVAATSAARVDCASRRPRRVAVEGDGRTSSQCVAFGSASTWIPSTRRRDASRSTWDVATVATPPSRGDTDVATSRDPREETTMRSNAPVSRTRARVGG